MVFLGAPLFDWLYRVFFSEHELKTFCEQRLRNFKKAEPTIKKILRPFVLLACIVLSFFVALSAYGLFLLFTS